MFSKSLYYFESSDYPSKFFPDILLDIARYDCDELVQGSLHLLGRYFSSEISLFTKAIQTQLLETDESKRVFKEVEEKVPILRRYMSVDVEEDERAHLIEILRTFTKMCSLEGEEQEPHQQNQKILYNFGKYTMYSKCSRFNALILAGVLSDVLSYVLQYANDFVASQSATTPAVEVPRQSWRKVSAAVMRKKAIRSGVGYEPNSMEEVFVESFKFLKAMARKNLEVQQRYMHCGRVVMLSVIVRWSLIISSSLPCLQTVWPHDRPPGD